MIIIIITLYITIYASEKAYYSYEKEKIETQINDMSYKRKELELKRTELSNIKNELIQAIAAKQERDRINSVITELNTENVSTQIQNETVVTVEPIKYNNTIVPKTVTVKKRTPTRTRGS